jgi:sulfur transfer complex TusBCD TusB component (DsrH family)
MISPVLYLIQSDYSNTANMLNKVLQLYTSDDSVVLMGEAILFSDQAVLKQLKKIYILENDAEIFCDRQTTDLNILNYSEFADLCLQYKQCITLK